MPFILLHSLLKPSAFVDHLPCRPDTAVVDFLNTIPPPTIFAQQRLLRSHRGAVCLLLLQLTLLLL